MCTAAAKLGLIQPRESRAQRERRELDALLDKCKADQAEYLRDPKPPVLKSCLSYSAQLKEGVKDAAMENQCATDLIDEVPSCGDWKRQSERYLEDAERRAVRSGGVVCQTLGNTTICD